MTTSVSSSSSSPQVHTPISPESNSTSFLSLSDSHSNYLPNNPQFHPPHFQSTIDQSTGSPSGQLPQPPGSHPPDSRSHFRHSSLGNNISSTWPPPPGTQSTVFQQSFSPASPSSKPPALPVRSPSRPVTAGGSSNLNPSVSPVSFPYYPNQPEFYHQQQQQPFPPLRRPPPGYSVSSGYPNNFNHPSFNRPIGSGRPIPKIPTTASPLSASTTSAGQPLPVPSPANLSLVGAANGSTIEPSNMDRQYGNGGNNYQYNGNGPRNGGGGLSRNNSVLSAGLGGSVAPGPADEMIATAQPDAPFGRLELSPPSSPMPPGMTNPGGTAVAINSDDDEDTNAGDFVDARTLPPGAMSVPVSMQMAGNQHHQNQSPSIHSVTGVGGAPNGNFASHMHHTHPPYYQTSSPPPLRHGTTNSISSVSTARSMPPIPGSQYPQQQGERPLSTASTITGAPPMPPIPGYIPQNPSSNMPPLVRQDSRPFAAYAAGSNPATPDHEVDPRQLQPETPPMPALPTTSSGIAFDSNSSLSNAHHAPQSAAEILIRNEVVTTDGSGGFENDLPHNPNPVLRPPRQSSIPGSSRNSSASELDNAPPTLMPKGGGRNHYTNVTLGPDGLIPTKMATEEEERAFWEANKDRFRTGIGLGEGLSEGLVDPATGLSMRSPANDDVYYNSLQHQQDSFLRAQQPQSAQPQSSHPNEGFGSGDNGESGNRTKGSLLPRALSKKSKSFSPTRGRGLFGFGGGSSAAASPTQNQFQSMGDVGNNAARQVKQPGYGSPDDKAKALYNPGIPTHYSRVGFSTNTTSKLGEPQFVQSGPKSDAGSVASGSTGAGANMPAYSSAQLPPRRAATDVSTYPSISNLSMSSSSVSGGKRSSSQYYQYSRARGASLPPSSPPPDGTLPPIPQNRGGYRDRMDSDMDAAWRDQEKDRSGMGRGFGGGNVNVGRRESLEAMNVEFRNIVVVGGGPTGADVANFLLKESNGLLAPWFWPPLRVQARAYEKAQAAARRPRTAEGDGSRPPSRSQSRSRRASDSDRSGLFSSATSSSHPSSAPPHATNYPTILGIPTPTSAPAAPPRPIQYRIIVIEERAFAFWPLASLRAAVNPGYEDHIVAPLIDDGDSLEEFGPVTDTDNENPNMLGAPDVSDAMSTRGGKGGKKKPKMKTKFKRKYGPFFYWPHIVLNETKVIEISAKTRHIILNRNRDDKLGAGTGTRLKYDYLVVATGSLYPHPCRPPPDATRIEDVKAAFQELQSDISKATSFLIIGGGPVGVEFAGEVLTLYPEKRVTLVTESPYLIGAPFQPKLGLALAKQLEKLGCRVICGLNVNIKDMQWGKLERMTTFTMTNGEKLEADFVLQATGNTPNVSLIENISPSSISRETGRIVVKPSLQLFSADKELDDGRIYCVGDVNEAGDMKMAATAPVQAACCATNILLQMRHRPLRDYKPISLRMFVPVGPNGGQCQMFGMSFGPFLTAMVKSQKLFLDLFHEKYEPKNPVYVDTL